MRPYAAFPSQAGAGLLGVIALLGGSFVLVPGTLL